MFWVIWGFSRLRVGRLRRLFDWFRNLVGKKEVVEEDRSMDFVIQSLIFVVVCKAVIVLLLLTIQKN